jgi:hypothetical protein
LEQFRTRQVKRIFLDFGAGLDEKLVQRFPKERERFSVVFDALINKYPVSKKP